MMFVAVGAYAYLFVDWVCWWCCLSLCVSVLLFARVDVDRCCCSLFLLLLIVIVVCGWRCLCLLLFVFGGVVVCVRCCWL